MTEKTQDDVQTEVEDLEKQAEAVKNIYGSERQRISTDADASFDDVLEELDALLGQESEYLVRIITPILKKPLEARVRPLTPAEESKTKGILFQASLVEIAEEVSRDSNWQQRQLEQLSEEEMAKRSLEQDIEVCLLGTIAIMVDTKEFKLTKKRLNTWSNSKDGRYIITMLASHIRGDATVAPPFPLFAEMGAES